MLFDDELLSIAIVLFTLGSLVIVFAMAAVALFRVWSLRQELHKLRADLKRLLAPKTPGEQTAQPLHKPASAPSAPQPTPAVPAAPVAAAPDIAAPSIPLAASPAAPATQEEPVVVPRPVILPPPSSIESKRKTLNSITHRAEADAAGTHRAPASSEPHVPGPPGKPGNEPTGEQLLVRVFIFIGGLALALAGLYFVKYAYDKGLLRPEVRLSIGALFGLALIATGEWLRFRSGRVAQACVAAGVAVLFAVILAGRHVEELFPSTVTFGLLLVVTIAAVVLSLRHGVFVAALGLIGGFATPALIGSSEHSPGTLFGYLFILQIGLSVVIRKRGWWWLSLLMLVGGYGWATLWLMFNFQHDDSVWLGAYLLLVGAMSVWNAGELRSRSGEDGTQATASLSPRAVVGWIGGIASMILAALMLPAGNYSWLEWGYMGLLGGGAIALGRLNERRIAMPVLAAILTFLSIIHWQINSLSLDGTMFAAAVIGAGILYGLGGYFCAWGSRAKGAWAWLSAVVSVVALVVMYIQFVRDVPEHLWLTACLSLCGLFTVMAMPWLNAREDTPDGEPVIAATSTTAAAFIAMAIPMALDQLWVGVGWAILTALLGVIHWRLRIPSLRVVMILVSVIACPMLLGATLARGTDVGHMLIANWLLFDVGVPMLAFAVAAYFLRRTGDTGAAEYFIALASIAALLFVTWQTRHVFHRTQWMSDVPGFGSLWELGTYAWVWLIAAVLLHTVGSHVASPCARAIALITGVGATMYSVGMLGLVFNPLWSRLHVGHTPIFNAILYAYGVPCAILFTIALWLRRRDKTGVAILAAIAGLLLLFIMTNLQVRQYFHGDMLRSLNQMTNAERYTYSAAWIVLAAILLIIGIRMRSLVLRWGSLVIMLMTIGKTFLDTRDLKDLYRVASFLGLGLALMAIGYLYHRFVFRRDATLDLQAEQGETDPDEPVLSGENFEIKPGDNSAATPPDQRPGPNI